MIDALNEAADLLACLDRLMAFEENTLKPWSGCPAILQTEEFNWDVMPDASSNTLPNGIKDPEAMIWLFRSEPKGTAGANGMPIARSKGPLCVVSMRDRLERCALLGIDGGLRVRKKVSSQF